MRPVAYGPPLASPAPTSLACPHGEEEGSALVLGVGLRLWQSALSFPSLSFLYKCIVFLLFGSTDNSSSSLLLHHLLVSTVHTSLPWPRWWCAVHKYWTVCCAIRYFQSRTKQKISSTGVKSQSKSRRANTQGDTCIDTDPTSAEDIANESSDLPDLDTEDEEVSRRKGSLGRKWKKKMRREMRRMAMRREMRKMSRFQTMTWSTV